MSGDFNTALGNSILNAIVLYSWARLRGIHNDPKFRIECDGDDSWMTLPASAADPQPGEFKVLGFTTKIEGIGTEPEDVEFCQMRPVEIFPDKWRMCRNPVRTFSRLPYSIQQYTSRKIWRAYAAGVAECEIAMGDGFPIFHQLGRSMRKAFHDEPLYTNEEKMKMKFEAQLVRHQQPTDCCRDSFARAWGIDVEEQLQLEEKLRTCRWVTPLTR